MYCLRSCFHTSFHLASSSGSQALFMLQGTCDIKTVTMDEDGMQDTWLKVAQKYYTGGPRRHTQWRKPQK
jgi:hypothetical protein